MKKQQQQKSKEIVEKLEKKHFNSTSIKNQFKQFERKMESEKRKKKNKQKNHKTEIFI